MTDIASLAFKVDSSQAKAATTDLDGMASAANKAQSSALLLQRSLEQGRLVFDQYSQGILGLSNNAASASRSIDEMVDRVARLSRSISDIGGDAGRPLREAIAQLQGLGEAVRGRLGARTRVGSHRRERQPAGDVDAVPERQDHLDTAGRHVGHLESRARSRRHPDHHTDDGADDHDHRTDVVANIDASGDTNSNTSSR